MSKIDKRQQEAAKLRQQDMRLYRGLRKMLLPIFTFLFRPTVDGRSNLPGSGAFVLAANHRSFFDSVFQGLVIDRPIHWMAKSELFKYPLIDRLLVNLGAFPVRRGQSDRQAIETAEKLLAAGEIVAVFPEGTRVREGLGQPRRGAARLAVDAGAPIVPMAIVGTEKGALRRAIWHQGERVRMVIANPIETDAGEAESVTEEVWPEVAKNVGLLEGRRRQAVALGASALVAAAATIFFKRRR